MLLMMIITMLSIMLFMITVIILYLNHPLFLLRAVIWDFEDTAFVEVESTVFTLQPLLEHPKQHFSAKAVKKEKLQTNHLFFPVLQLFYNCTGQGVEVYVDTSLQLGCRIVK